MPREDPFRHWVADHAISSATITAINEEWPDIHDSRWMREKGAFCRKWSMPIRQSGIARRILDELNSPETCALIADLIGEPVVHPDPSQFGGGLHAIPSGGFLKMHTDFQYHKNTTRRRVANVLLYVNRIWLDGWGGELTLGEGPEQVSYAPLGGRMVIFRTDKDSWHGHPFPTKTPGGIMRRSIAVYYYGEETGKPDSTVYRK